MELEFCSASTDRANWNDEERIAIVEGQRMTRKARKLMEIEAEGWKKAVKLG